MLLIVIKPSRFCAAAIGSLNCTSAYCSSSADARTSSNLKSPSAGTSICSSPFWVLLMASPFHCSNNFCALFVRGILVNTNSCSLADSLCCQLTGKDFPSSEAINIFSIPADCSTSAVNILPDKFILVLLLLCKPYVFTSKDGFTTWRLNVNALNFEGSFITSPNLKLTSYNSPGFKSLPGLNSMVLASIQYAFPSTAGEKENSRFFISSLIVCVVETPEDSCMRTVLFLDTTPEVYA